MSEKDTGASRWRQRYWDECGKPPEGPPPHDDRGGPAYIPWLEAKLDNLGAENEALKEYALSLMANSYHGMSREERKLILESELIALLTAGVLDGS